MGGNAWGREAIDDSGTPDTVQGLHHRVDGSGQRRIFAAELRSVRERVTVLSEAVALWQRVGRQHCQTRQWSLYEFMPLIIIY